MYNEWASNGMRKKTGPRKHAGIDFETASRVFVGPNLLLRKYRLVDGEQRCQAIGVVGKAVELRRFIVPLILRSDCIQPSAFK